MTFRVQCCWLVSSISGIPVLGLRHCCAPKFTASYDGSHSTAAAYFTDSTFAILELAVNILRKVKSVKTSLSNTRFIQITKPNQDLV
jgi:hypothetical protein